VFSAGEISRGTEGALKFLQRDRTAPFHYDNSFAACLHSFRVMVLVAPLYAIYRLLFYANVTTMADDIEIVAVEALRYVVEWLLFPVVYYEIARQRLALDSYPRYIAALNWINLPATIVAILAFVVELVAPSAVARIVAYGVQFLMFYWFLMATRLTVGASWLYAGLLLLVNFVPSVVLSLIVFRYLGVGPLAGG